MPLIRSPALVMCAKLNLTCLWIFLLQIMIDIEDAFMFSSLKHIIIEVWEIKD